MNVYELFEPLNEKWSEKYKRSINCANPQGFSQRAHCAGRKKNESYSTGEYASSADQNQIPTKMINAGYVVTFDPKTRHVTIAKAGKVHSQFTFKGTQSFSNYKKYVERAIEILNNKQYGINENSQKPDVTKAFVKKFLPWLQRELGIKQLPKIELLDKPMTTSFGSYDSENNCLYVVTAGRHPVDVLRTLAHELTHHKQNQAGILDSHSGATGTDEENEANANAGIVMRDFAKQNPHYFGLDK